MKKKVSGIIVVVVIAIVAGYNAYASVIKDVKWVDFVLADVEALAQNENGNYSCTVSVDCGWPLLGSISCTGINCSRGIGWSGAYVECNGNRTYCV